MKDDTLITTAGRDSAGHFGVVNDPVYRTSTVIYPDMQSFLKRHARRYTGVMYGAYGTPTTINFAAAMAALETGYGSVVVSSGLAAVTLALMAFVRAGDHILVTDNVYGPTRSFCDTVLAAFDVRTTYYDPLIGGSISELFQPNTRLVFLESPGSITFEVQDVPAIARAAHDRGLLVAMDNTWATPLFFKPIGHGVDLSIQAGTKSIGGHSDLVIGVVTARTKELFEQLKDFAMALGEIAGPDDCHLALRGLRTLSVRMRAQEKAALKVARWFQDQEEVDRVLYPALPGDPHHDIWRRDFTGAASLFSVAFAAGSTENISKMVDGHKLIKIGASWGGYESLVLPADPARDRAGEHWKDFQPVLRFYIGLEAPEDILADLREGFRRLRADS